MTLFRSLAMYAILSIVVMAGTSRAASIVAFGNLGNSGSSALGSGFNDFGPAVDEANLLTAQPFRTGTSPNFLELVSVSAGLSATSTTSVQLSIHPIVSGTPGAALYTSLPVSVSAKQIYEFGFPALYTLTPSTDYFVVATAGSGTVSWYLQNAGPIPRNSSGYAASNLAASLRYGQYLPPDEPDVGWWTAASNFQSISILAIPEPSTIVPACVGLVGGVAGMGRTLRRRRKPANEAVTTG